jgi:hypothetical protein
MAQNGFAVEIKTPNEEWVYNGIRNTQRKTIAKHVTYVLCRKYLNQITINAKVNSCIIVT